MIDRQHNALFVHVPKTGGQSVESVFLALHGLGWEERAPLLLRPNDDPAIGPSRLAHLTATEYVGLGHLTQAEYDGFYKFAFVRNPFARLVSGFHYRELGPEVSFADFVRRTLDYTDTFPDFARHSMPQSDYVCDADGRLIVDFVGKFETLAADFAHVAEQLGLPSRELPHRNKSDAVSLLRKNPKRFLRQNAQRLLRGDAPATPRRKHYADYFTPALADEVAAFYKRDLELFGYSFEAPAEPKLPQPQDTN